MTLQADRTWLPAKTMNARPLLLILICAFPACGILSPDESGTPERDQQEVTSKPSPEAPVTDPSGLDIALADSNQPELKPETWIIPALSQDPRPETTQGLRVAFSLVAAIEESNLKPHWNEAGQEGILQFIFASRESYGEVPYTPKRTYYISSEVYLYTDFSQRELGYPYDNQGGLIRLRYFSESIPVGRYRTPLTGKEYQTWSHPFFCEEEFASTCQLTVGLTFNAEKKHTQFPYRGTFFVTLKPGVLGPDPVQIPLAVIPEVNAGLSGNPFGVAQPKTP